MHYTFESDRIEMLSTVTIFKGTQVARRALYSHVFPSLNAYCTHASTNSSEVQCVVYSMVALLKPKDKTTLN